MMTIETIPEGTLVKDIKVKLPDDVHQYANQFYDNLPKEVWLSGPMMGDWFVKINHDDTRVYPLFRSYIPYQEIKDWEVVELFKSEENDSEDNSVH